MLYEQRTCSERYIEKSMFLNHKTTMNAWEQPPTPLLYIYQTARDLPGSRSADNCVTMQLVVVPYSDSRSFTPCNYFLYNQKPL